MKKILLLMIISFFLSACSVDSNTGGITVVNQSDHYATNVKAGSVNIGFVGAGQTYTVYFNKEENSARISMDGFKPQYSSLKGTIKLKLGYSYVLELFNRYDNYVFFMDGKKILNTTDNDSYIQMY